MPAPLVPIIVAAATAGIGWFFQNTSANIANQRAQRRSELARAHEVFKDVSHAVDTLYYYLRNGAMYVAVRKALNDESRKDQDVETWDGYEKAVLGWKSHRTRFVAQVQRYFGSDIKTRLLAIQSEFDQAEDAVEDTYYQTPDSLVRGGDADVEPYNERLDALEGELLSLSEHMIREIQNENVGSLRVTDA